MWTHLFSVALFASSVIALTYKPDLEAINATPFPNADAPGVTRNVYSKSNREDDEKRIQSYFQFLNTSHSERELQKRADWIPPPKTWWCPNYSEQTIVIDVYARYYYWEQWRKLGPKNARPAYYGSHRQEAAQEAVDQLNAAFSARRPHIRFRLAPDSPNDEQAGVRFKGYSQKSDWDTQSVGKENALFYANECRGPADQRPRDQHRQLWLYVVSHVHDSSRQPIIAWTTDPYDRDDDDIDGVWVDTNYFMEPYIWEHSNTAPGLLPHEVGRWLGLSPIFTGGCDGPNDWWHGDGLPDTPKWPVKDAPNSCPFYGVTYESQRKNSCNPHATPEEIAVGVNNYMSNSMTNCLQSFTQQQHDRMWKVATTIRGFEQQCNTP